MNDWTEADPSRRVTKRRRNCVKNTSLHVLKVDRVMLSTYVWQIRVCDEYVPGKSHLYEYDFIKWGMIELEGSKRRNAYG